MTVTFETALSDRGAAMADACTRCGKCVEVCPVTGPGGVNAEPIAVISGVIDILRTGDGPEASRKWANACVLSGECIKACDYGVNPRFMLNMARVKMAQHANAAPEQRRGGVEGFRKVAREVQHISRMQLDDKILERLGQTPDNRPSPDVQPDFVFYTGCNVLKTPHIALLALDIMDTLAITYKVMGGPTHCCGVVQMRTGDVATSAALRKPPWTSSPPARPRRCCAWCPSCHTQFTETTLPTIEKTRGSKPFEMTPFMLFLRGISTGCGRSCASAWRCASRCIAIPASRAWSRPPRTSCRRCRVSSWSI